MLLHLCVGVSLCCLVLFSKCVLGVKHAVEAERRHAHVDTHLVPDSIQLGSCNKRVVVVCHDERRRGPAGFLKCVSIGQPQSAVVKWYEFFCALHTHTPAQLRTNVLNLEHVSPKPWPV